MQSNYGHATLNEGLPYRAQEASMAKNRNRQQPRRQNRTADEQRQERERARSAAAERATTETSRKGRERRFGHN